MLVAIAAPGFGDLGEDGAEAGVAPAILGREVGAAEEGLEFGREPDGHRPAAAAGGGLDEGHVDAVDVGALFAIDFDADEVAVEELRRWLSFSNDFALHDVAPVAGGVADGKEDGLVFAARLFERFVAPGIPVHGIVGVLEQVGTLLLGQTIGVHRFRWKDPFAPW